MHECVEIIQRPSFKGATLITGFGGWPNAGEVSTWVVKYLIQTLGATKCAQIRPEIFFDWSQHRPLGSISAGLIRSVTFPTNAFYAVQTPEPKSRGLVFFVGQEPHLQWPQFTQVFLDLAQHFGITELYTVGGLYDNVPHTVEPRISGLTNQEQRLELFSNLKIFPSEYEGPISIHSHLIMSAGHRNIPATSLWGHVPYYIQSNNAKTCLAILERLRRMLDIDIDLEDVHRASELLDQQIDRIIQSKPDLREYIQSLEEDYASGEKASRRKTDPMRHQPTGEKIIRIDPFLRKDEDPYSTT
jgi:proteasome assembly chaperone (PAC2) family protein